MIGRMRYFAPDNRRYLEWLFEHPKAFPACVGKCQPESRSYRHHDHDGVPDFDLVTFLQQLGCVDAAPVERSTVG
jgi:hypothetical protein